MFRCSLGSLLWRQCGWCERNRNKKWGLSTYIRIDKLDYNIPVFSWVHVEQTPSNRWRIAVFNTIVPLTLSSPEVGERKPGMAGPAGADWTTGGRAAAPGCWPWPGPRVCRIWSKLFSLGHLGWTKRMAEEKKEKEKGKSNEADFLLREMSC